MCAASAQCTQCRQTDRQHSLTDTYEQHMNGCRGFLLVPFGKAEEGKRGTVPSDKREHCHVSPSRRSKKSHARTEPTRITPRNPP
mmetsp:Transcript_1423/g.3816  ORF Transcript_1423/g.3816 Transcript_1423/m.3816 type:complete len:85 (-) Transcript_1423:133-387(-)